ncbi:MAG: hypothetical protein WDZ80_05645 [Candidatus Paceibacterota bacterium]
MRSIFVLSALLIIISECNAQLKLEIRELYITSISDSSHFSFEAFEGPNISARCDLVNNSNESLLILPLSDSIILSYYIKGIEYERVERPYNFPDRQSLIIEPFDTLSFSFSDNIFLGTKYISEIDHDYSMLLIEALPSMQIQYRTHYLPVIINERIDNIKIIK